MPDMTIARCFFSVSKDIKEDSWDCLGCVVGV